jgi:hypothetical protein
MSAAEVMAYISCLTADIEPVSRLHLLLSSMHVKLRQVLLVRGSGLETITSYSA